MNRALSDPQRWIRVLELLPGERGDIIRLRLHHKKISSMRTCYEALSYTWGDDTKRQEVVFEDDDYFAGNRYEIQYNLWKFLWTLRERFASRYLWADALCINQRNTVEKGHQVRIMGRIFNKAKRVLVWLGEAHNGTDTAMKVATMTDWSMSNDLQNETTCKSAEAILSRPYWKRTWIVQELVQAKRIIVHYGDCKAAWNEFEPFIRRCFDHSTPEYSQFLTLANKRRAWHKIGWRECLCTLARNVGEFKGTQCKDPRDKVYAFLSISAPPPGKRSLPVDYSSEVDLVELYYRAREIYIEPLRDSTKDFPLAEAMEDAFGLTKENISEHLAKRGGLQLQKASSSAKVIAKGKILWATCPLVVQNYIPNWIIVPIWMLRIFYQYAHALTCRFWEGERDRRIDFPTIMFDFTFTELERSFVRLDAGMITRPQPGSLLPQLAAALLF